MSELKVTAIEANNTVNAASAYVGNTAVYAGGIYLAGDNSVDTNTIIESVTHTGGQQTLDITYGNGTFYACGYGGKISKSNDHGVTWTYLNSITTNNLRGIAYGNGKIVAIGAVGNAYVSSDDGTTWTNAAMANTTSTMRGIIYGNGYFVAVGANGVNGVIQSSTDGTTWSVQYNDTTSTPWDIAYGNGVFVVVGSGNGVTVSYGTPNNFTKYATVLAGTSSPAYYGIDYSEDIGRFYAVGKNNYVVSSLYSSTSTAWDTLYSEVTPGSFYHVAVGGNTVIATSLTNNYILKSSDYTGTSWYKINVSTTLTTNVNGVKFGNGAFTFGCEDVATSTFYYTPKGNVDISPSGIRVGNNKILANSSVASINIGGTTFTSYPTEIVNTQIFTANGTWTKPTWATDGKELIIAHLWGGGGGGSINAGGGGGAFVFGYFIANNLSATEAVVVGTAGLEGLVDGTAGGSSSFANLVAYGGGYGSANASANPSTAAGSGGGWQGPGSNTFAGGPRAGTTLTPDSIFGGGRAYSLSSYPGNTIYGGGGGGGGASAPGGIGGSSIFGGGGGSLITVAPGLSIYGGRGSNSTAAGIAPGGGGSGSPSNGAIGEVRIYTLRIIS